VGYGDIITRNNLERLYCIFLELIGTIIFATIIAAITSVVTSSDMNARKTAEQLDAVASFVQVRQFPENMARRIRRHFRRFYSVKSAIDETKIFSELSSSLQAEVSMYLVNELMGDESFFMNMSSTMWPRLLPLLRPMEFDKDETVCRQGEECTEMYVVISGGGSLRGEMSVEGERGVPRSRNIFTGGSVNVLHVLGIWHQCVETVTASTYVETYAISAQDFEGLFTSDADRTAYAEMQRREVRNFKMDKTLNLAHPAPTEWGKPLHYSCFTVVEFSLLEVSFDLSNQQALSNKLARAAATSNNNSGGSSWPETWLVVDLVDLASGKPYNDVWRVKTEQGVSKDKGVFGVSCALYFGHHHRWTDVSVPFEKAAIRVRLYVSDGKGSSSGPSETSNENCVVGRALVPLTSVEERAGAQTIISKRAAAAAAAAASAAATNSGSAGGGAGGEVGGGATPLLPEKTEEGSSGSEEGGEGPRDNLLAATGGGSSSSSGSKLNVEKGWKGRSLDGELAAGGGATGTAKSSRPSTSTTSWTSVHSRRDCEFGTWLELGESSTMMEGNGHGGLGGHHHHHGDGDKWGGEEKTTEVMGHRFLSEQPKAGETAAPIMDLRLSAQRPEGRRRKRRSSGFHRQASLASLSYPQGTPKSKQAALLSPRIHALRTVTGVAAGVAAGVSGHGRSLERGNSSSPERRRGSSLERRNSHRGSSASTSASASRGGAMTGMSLDRHGAAPLELDSSSSSTL
jgi:hypothetical protein